VGLKVIQHTVTLLSLLLSLFFFCCWAFTNFCFCCSYSNLLKMSNVGKFIPLELISWEPHSSLERERKINVITCSCPPIKCEIRHFCKEMYKKMCCTCKVVVLLNKPKYFLTFLLPSPWSLLNLPNESLF